MLNLFFYLICKPEGDEHMINRQFNNEKEVRYTTHGQALFGGWRADLELSSGLWEPDKNFEATVRLYFSAEVITSISALREKSDSILMLLTSERCFDPEGWLRLPSDERMSTLLTPTRLPIEGGSTGAISRNTGSRFRNPVDEFAKIPLSELHKDDDNLYWVDHQFKFTLPQDIPPGIYRLRIDFGISSGNRDISLNNEKFAVRQEKDDQLSLMYSPPFACTGVDVAGNQVDVSTIAPRIYWVLLRQYNSNGYNGVIADEDKLNFALSERYIIHDEVILPLYDKQGNKLSYNLEPTFAADLVDKQRNIPWDYSSGLLSIQVIGPNGVVKDLGSASFSGLKESIVTTDNPDFTAWQPNEYGRHTVIAKGWIADIWGNRYYGGGTYQFWIAKRMTLISPIFQGMSFPLSPMSYYGREINLAPALPADITIKADFYPYSDPTKVQSLTDKGKVPKGGAYNADHWVKRLQFEVPGEYHANILATCIDSEGHLWVSTMRHAGVAFQLDSPLIVHGKKKKIENELLERGETHFEGYIDEENGTRHIDYMNFPYRFGDVLLIASDGNGANRVEPVLTYELKNDNTPYDPKLTELGATNVRIETANGMSPHLYPEYITDWAYYYAGAHRQGNVAQFLVGEDGVHEAYWQTSANNSGGQIAISNNGDVTGTLQRLLGGVVLRRNNMQPLYGGYAANASILPKGTNNNRVIRPGDEDVIGADGRKRRFFLVQLRPGTLYEQGQKILPALQIDPFVPANLRLCLKYPDGNMRVAEGIGNPFGYWADPEPWELDQPGVYILYAKTDWQGHQGNQPGMRYSYLFVYDKDRPANAELKLNLKRQQSFTVEQGLTIEGFTSADTVYYGMMTPGSAVAQGRIPVQDGRFQYHFDPVAVNKLIPIYDIKDKRTGRQEIGRAIHLTFFAAERAADGTKWHSFARVIMRGTTAIYTF